MDKVYMRRYSEAFRKTVVQEYEGGQSITQLQRRYGIGGNETIQKWIRRYGVAGLRHEVVVMQRADEQRREKELEARIKELEAALSQLTLDKLMLETTLEVASERYGEDIKKKYAPKSLSGRTRRKKEEQSE